VKRLRGRCGEGARRQPMCQDLQEIRRTKYAALQSIRPCISAGGCSWKFPPALTAVPPGDSVILQVSFPLVIGRLTREFSVEEIDISKRVRVDCRVGYADTPFEPDFEQSAEQLPRDQMRHQLQAWQETAQTKEKPTRAKAPRRTRRSRKKTATE
jgi:hypothetical protein